MGDKFPISFLQKMPIPGYDKIREDILNIRFEQIPEPLRERYKQRMIDMLHYGFDLTIRRKPIIDKHRELLTAS